MKVNRLVLLLQNLIQIGLKRVGKEVTRFPIVTYLKDFEIDCVLDVGANTGQYAKEIFSLGYKKRIESFEPNPAAFKVLSKNALRHANWKAHPFALGETDSTSEMKISKYSPSSSFLPLADVEHQLDLSYVGQESVKIKRLDDVYDEVVGSAKCVFLKIDTQGFERQVLRGASERLKDIRGIQLETSLVPQYVGESLVEEHIAYLRERSFVPFWCMQGYKNIRTLQLYQVDFIFFRKDA